MNQSSTTPVSILNRWIAVSVVFIGVLLLTARAFTTGSKLLLLGLIVAPVVLLLINRLQMWCVLAVGLFSSWIYIPGFPTSLALHHLLLAGTIPFLAAGRLLGHPPRLGRSKGLLNTTVIGFAIVLLLTMKVRGFGVKFMGGEMWGGAGYVHLTITIAFYLFSSTVQLTRRQVAIMVALFFGAGVLPSMAEMLFLLSKGSVQWQYYFVRPEGTSARLNLADVQLGIGIVRFQVSKYVMLLFPLALALLPYRGRNKFIIWATCALGFGFAGLSGHRSAIIYLLVLLPTIMFFTTGRAPVRLLMGVFGGLALLVFCLHVFGSNLPLAAQRAFSWVPLANISEQARASAEATTIWRLDVWRRAMSLLPGHWLIGRGLAFNSLDFYALAFNRNAYIEWAVVTHNYHSGPLSLLVDLGAFGLAFGAAIMFGGLIRHYRIMRREWCDSDLARYHRVLLASFAVEIFLFIFIHGDVSTSLSLCLIEITIMEFVHRADRLVATEYDSGPR